MNLMEREEGFGRPIKQGKKNLLRKGSTLDSKILEDFFKYQAFPHVNS